MNKDCNKIIEEILSSNGDCSQAVHEHCRDCSECRTLLEDWQKMYNAKLPLQAPPLSADFNILKQSRERGKSIRLNKTIRRLVGYTAAAASLAAAFIVTCSEYNSVRLENKYLNQWSWSSFENQVFTLDTEVEFSKELLTISNTNDDALQQYVNNEINLENL
ncbi:MAG: hypothetical protein GY750_15785 [Lentisphaerae bacterium]|nr:hypothetical protein [Lentisphaerota bacterium]MCP4102859.1 hypothetical protein [Lentisphaerota bacterium]